MYLLKIYKPILILKYEAKFPIISKIIKYYESVNVYFIAFEFLFCILCLIFIIIVCSIILY